MMAIGYACLHIGSNKTNLSTIRVSGYSDDRLRAVITKNLNALHEIIKYNIDNDIRLYRISSDMIPLATHPVNNVNWLMEFKNKLDSIGRDIHESGMRVSMHPGQYTVLNSIKEDVVKAAAAELEYHSGFLTALGCGSSSKIILHIGGVYSDKKASIERFINNTGMLNEGVRSRLAIENDDRSYDIKDVLYISDRTGIPVVFDNLHHKLNPPSENEYDEYEWIALAAKTWKIEDGKQKIHYSQAGDGKRPGAHSRTIKSSKFLDFYKNINPESTDIMLEVKDKNLSAVKCILLTEMDLKKTSLENEWAKYKYLVLSKTAAAYNSIRILFHGSPLPLDFYSLVENALVAEGDKGSEINAAMHVWGYFKKKADQTEKLKFLSLIKRYEEKNISSVSLKKFLFRLSEKYDCGYLLNSLYFYF